MKNRERAAFNRNYRPPSQPEDELTTKIDDYAGSLPSAGFLGVAMGAMLASLILQSSGSGKWGNFIAQWVPSWLLLGVYSKIVKLRAHDLSDSSDRGSYFE